MPPYDIMTLGKKIEMLRAVRRISQVEIADTLGVSQGLVSLWQRDVNTPSLLHGAKLAAMFEVPVGYLADEADERPIVELKAELDVRSLAQRFGWPSVFDQCLSLNAPDRIEHHHVEPKASGNPRKQA